MPTVSIAELVRSWLPNITAVSVEGSSHFLQMEKPVEIGERLLGFLTQHLAATA
jgi:pimeloyl-ACP methyl ester carboxylesterase